MRTTFKLDDDLLRQAIELTGITETASLLNESLNALIERETSRRLALLRGSESQLSCPPLHRMQKDAL